MAHQEMSLLVKAQDIEEAEEKAESFMLDTLEYEHPFFDYYSILPHAICPLASELERLRSLHTIYEPQRLIAQFLSQSETLKAQDGETAGYYYCKAGNIYRHLLIDDIPFYNVSLKTYDIPPNPAGWFVVPVDCHC